MTDDDTGMERRGFLRLTGAAAGAAAMGVPAAATPGREPGPKEDEVLVGVSAGNDLRGTVAPAVPGNAQIVHSNDTLRYVAVKFSGQAVDQAQQNFIDAVTNRPGVKYAEVNETFETQLAPNDPREPDQPSLDLINARAAWDTTLGDSGVLISIVDTGVQYRHPDLSGAFGSDKGRDFVDADQDPEPDSLSNEIHGTHVAGIAGAVTDNSTGVAGVSNCSLIAGRALDESGSGSLSDISDAIEWSATTVGADIVNLSLGGGGYNSTMKNAVSTALNNGCLPIAAAGNDGSTSVSYPAAYSEVVAVSAVDSNGNLASFTNTGDDVEVAAPGVDYLSTYPDDTYQRLSGTSMASPCAAGVAGLIISQWGTDASTTRQHLKDTAQDTSLSSTEEGAGIVDAQNAVETDPSGGGGGGGGGSCTTASVSDSLADYTDADCWSYAWEKSSTSSVTVTLDGPSDADFDLYVDDGEGDCPGPNDYDYASFSTDSQEQVSIDSPDTSTDLTILVDSYSGGGSYTLSIEECGS